METRAIFVNELKKKGYADFKPMIKQGKYFFQFGRLDKYSASSLFYQERIDENADELVVSPDQFDRSKSEIASIQGFKLSKDHRYIAISLSFSGSDWREIRIMDLKKKKPLIDQIQWVRFSDIHWKDNGFFYCRYDEPEAVNSLSAIRNQRLFYHTLGTDQAADQLVYEIPNSSYSYFNFEVSFDQSTLFLYTVITSKNKKYYAILSKNLNVPEANYFNHLITWPYLSKTSFSVIHKEGNKVLVLSNKEGFNRSILEFDLDKQNEGVSLIPPAKGVLETAQVIGKKLVCLYVQDYQTFFSVYDLNGNLLKTWGIPPTAAVHAVYGDAEDTQMIYYFESFFYPPSFYTADLQTFERKPVSWTGILFSTDNMVTDYVTYPSRDGTLIPMYITHKAGIKMNGNNPCLVTGYGGFGISATPSFDPAYQVIYENGGIVAVACVRGGGEKEGWHDAGRNLNKVNSIDDFIYAAEYLIKENFTSKEKLAAYGASNGGMLVAAAMLKRPDLFSSIVSEVGVHDMLRYQHFTGGHLWSEEYGLSTDSKEFENLLTYSPIHNLKKGIDYPPTLLLTAENDERVPPLHSYKFIAALQNSGSSENLYLLYTQKMAGHSGSPIRDIEMKKEAFKLAFIFYHWGMKKALVQKY